MQAPQLMAVAEGEDKEGLIMKLKLDKLTKQPMLFVSHKAIQKQQNELAGERGQKGEQQGLDYRMTNYPFIKKLRTPTKQIFKIHKYSKDNFN